MTFDVADTRDMYYNRFGIFAGFYGQHPVLAVGTQKTRIYMWDLENVLNQYGEERDDLFDGHPFRRIAPHFEVDPFKHSKEHVRPKTTSMRAAAWSPDGKWLITGGDRAYLFVCSKITPKQSGSPVTVAD